MGFLLVCLLAASSPLASLAIDVSVTLASDPLTPFARLDVASVSDSPAPAHTYAPQLLVDHRGNVHDLKRTAPAVLDKYIREACQHAGETAAAASMARAGLRQEGHKEATEQKCYQL